MLILAIDSSGLTASAALVSEEKTVAEYTVDHKKTHSATLLPMIDEMVRMSGIALSSVDAIAVAGGPGSFTGLRIGSATAKGLGLALQKPVVSVPTLDAIAYNIYGCGDIICPIMDARRDQVYTGIYSFSRRAGTKEGENLFEPVFQTIRMQMAAGIDELISRLNRYNRPVVFTGDAAPVYRGAIEKGMKVPYSFAPTHMNRQRAAAVGALGIKRFKAGRYESAADHKPEYLRPSQAERVRGQQKEGAQRKEKPAAKVRELTLNDTKDVELLERKIFSDAWSEKSIQDSLKQPYSMCLAAESAGRLCGYMIAYEVSGEAEVARIAVDTDLRRMHVATALMRGFKKLCAKRGLTRILLEVREGNDAARAFYVREGFGEDGRRRGFYIDPEEDAVLMSCAVDIGQAKIKEI